MINNPPISRRASFFDGPLGTYSLGYDFINAGAAPSSISPPLPSSCTTNPASVIPQQAKVNGTSRSDGHDLQPGDVYLAIDVGPPAFAVQVEPVEFLVVSGIGPPQERLGQGYVAIHTCRISELGR